MSEEQDSWINKNTNHIILQDDESPIIEDWMTVQYNLRKTFWRKSVIEPAGLIFYSIIYALITTAVYQDDPNRGDHIINALFLPLWPMLFIAFKSIGDFLRALLYSFFALFTISQLYLQGEISVEGIVFLRFLLFLDKILNFGLIADLSNATPDQVLGVVSVLFINIVVFEFIFLIIHSIYVKYKGKTFVEMVLSTKNIYLRTITKITKFDLVKQVFFIILSPFNITSYSKIYKRIKHSLRRNVEGIKYDYAKIPVESIKKLGKQSESKKKNVLLGLIYIVVGLITMQIGIGILFLVLGFRKLLMKVAKEVDISILFNRELVEGSFLMLSNDSIIDLFQMQPEIANNFPESK